MVSIRITRGPALQQCGRLGYSPLPPLPLPGGAAAAPLFLSKRRTTMPLSISSQLQPLHWRMRGRLSLWVPAGGRIFLGFPGFEADRPRSRGICETSLGVEVQVWWYNY